MRALAILAGVVVVLLVAGFAALPLLPPPPSRFSVTVAGTGNLVSDERELAQPLENQLSALPGVQRLTTRITESAVVIEVQSPEGTSLGLTLDLRELPVGTLPPVVRLLQKTESAWWSLPSDVRSGADQRDWAEHHVREAIETQAGVRKVSFCGPELAVPTVRIDVPRIAAMGVSLHDVALALNDAPESIEALGKLPLNDRVRLNDVAIISLESPPTRCLGFANLPTLLMQVRHTPGTKPTSPEGTALGRLYSAVVRWPADVPPSSLRELAPAAMLFHPRQSLELLFTQPIDAATRSKLSAFFAGRPGAALESLEGVKHVKAYVVGADRDQLRGVATKLVELLRATPGVAFVTPLAEEKPRLDLKIDRDRAMSLGVAVSEISEAFALGAEGLRRRTLRIVVDRADSPEKLLQLPVHGVPLSAVVALESKEQPAELVRRNRRRAIEVTAWGIGKNAVPLPALPPGVTLEIEDEL